MLHSAVTLCATVVILVGSDICRLPFRFVWNGSNWFSTQTVGTMFIIGRPHEVPLATQPLGLRRTNAPRVIASILTVLRAVLAAILELFFNVQLNPAESMTGRVRVLSLVSFLILLLLTSNRTACRRSSRRPFVPCLRRKCNGRERSFTSDNLGQTG